MLNYIILGIIQGLTEFLPVSSSGHLVIFGKLLEVGANQVALAVVLHLGTVLSVLVFFRKELRVFLKDRKLLLLGALVVLITGLIGILGKDFFEKLFVQSRAVAIGWVFCGVILICTRNFNRGEKKNLNFKDAVILGLTQALAIIPGVSRSGITISTLLFRQIDKSFAFTFSFLVSLPLILGATILEAKDIRLLAQADIHKLSAGFIFSFIIGLCALYLLKRVLANSKFYYFGYYCIFMAVITFIFIK